MLADDTAPAHGVSCATAEISVSEADESMMAARRSLGEVCVPTVHRFGPYKFFFWSHENRSTSEPPHIHVTSGQGLATFWLAPVAYRDSWGYTPREIDRIRRLVVANRQELVRHWNDFFNE